LLSDYSSNGRASIEVKGSTHRHPLARPELESLRPQSEYVGTPEAHHPRHIRRAASTRGTPRSSYLSRLGLARGASMASVTTFAVVTGVGGAELSIRIILISRIANLLADGFSMAASNYLGTAHGAARSGCAPATRAKSYPPPTRPANARRMRQILAAKGFAAKISSAPS
jgi:hypothetical protein